MNHRVHLSSVKKRKLEKNMALKARFQKLGAGSPDCHWGWGTEFSEVQGGAKISDVAGFFKGSYHVFLQSCYFCGNIVINCSCHYVYSNIFGITCKKRSWP